MRTFYNIETLPVGTYKIFPASKYNETVLVVTENSKSVNGKELTPEEIHNISVFEESNSCQYVAID